jgi:hypothetical protein
MARFSKTEDPIAIVPLHSVTTKVHDVSGAMDDMVIVVKSLSELPAQIAHVIRS